MGSDTTIYQENTKLRQLRHERGWSQLALAEKIGTTTENVCRWERGRTRPGSYYKYRLSIIFEVSPQELELALSPALYLSTQEVASILEMVSELTQEVQQLRQMVNRGW